MTNMPKKLENSTMNLNSRPVTSVYNNFSGAHSFIKDKNAWENAIQMYQGPDPLDHWYNYICWYENHRHADPENLFRNSLERCLSIFEHNEYYKQDVRMVRLWLKYIDMQPNPLHFYQVLHTRGVGRQVAAFYISWANYYESVNALKEAEAVFNVAFKEKAQSYAELHHAHSKFLYAHSTTGMTPPAATTTSQPNLFKTVQQQQEQHVHQQHYHEQTTQIHHQQQQQHDVAVSSYGQIAAHRQQQVQQHNEQISQHANSSQLQMSPQVQNYRQQTIYHHQQNQTPNHHIHHQQQQQQQLSQQHIAVQQQTVYQQPVELNNYNHSPQHTNHHQMQHHQQLQHPQHRVNDIGQQTNYLQHQLNQPHTPPVEQQLPPTNLQTMSQAQSQQPQCYIPQATQQHLYQQHQQHHQQEQKIQLQPQSSLPEQEPATVQEKVFAPVPGIKLPKKFASYSRNNYETWKPALFLEEPADPCRQCHYQKHLVYPEGQEIEYSPEELRGKSYLEKLQLKIEQTSKVSAHIWNNSKIENYSQHSEQTEERVFQQISSYSTVEQNAIVYDGVKSQNGVNAVAPIDRRETGEVEEQEEYEDDDNEDDDGDDDCDDDDEDDDDDQEEDETEQVQVNTIEDVEDQIEASTIHFSMHSDQRGIQNKTIKIKFKKEPTSHTDTHNKTFNGNYSAYTVVQNIYQHEQSHHFNHIKSTNNQINSPEVRRNGHNHSFHPYMIGQTSTPKAATAGGAQRHYHRSKLKKVSKFPITMGSSSNSSSADNANGLANGHGYTTHNYHGTSVANIDNSLPNASFNDNANYSFSSAVALENSNCSLTSAVDRLNFRDTTIGGVGGTSKLNSTNVADFSTYQENSFFATQHDTEAKERRLQKALTTIATHFEKTVIDPFSSELCRAFLTKLDFPNADDGNAAVNSLRIIQTPLPKLANTRVLSLPEAGNSQYNIDKEVGRGSYGSVYKATDVHTGAVVALKYQKPPNTWEIYICDQVLRRIKSPNILPGLMDISSAVIAPNASLIATEFSPFGSLLDINNKIRQSTTKVMHESLVMHFSAQICKIIHHLHKEKIIHADIKPDNFLLMRIPSTDLHYPSLRLIDFGCAIDMTLFPDPEKTKFRKVIQTDGFTCIEMQEGRSWSYETDIFCIAGTVHVMLLGEYMQLQKRVGIWDIKQKLPRYLKKHVWNKFFGEILNIKDGRLPDLNEFHAIFEEEARKMDSELQKQIRTLSNILYRR